MNVNIELIKTNLLDEYSFCISVATSRIIIIAYFKSNLVFAQSAKYEIL
jgi:hypothetical protein